MCCLEKASPCWCSFVTIVKAHSEMQSASRRFYLRLSPRLHPHCHWECHRRPGQTAQPLSHPQNLVSLLCRWLCHWPVQTFVGIVSSTYQLSLQWLFFLISSDIITGGNILKHSLSKTKQDASQPASDTSLCLEGTGEPSEGPGWIQRKVHATNHCLGIYLSFVFFHLWICHFVLSSQANVCSEM